MEFKNFNISEKIGINEHFLNQVLYNSDRYYNTYYIRKSSGTKRTIDAPSYRIKSIQAWILRNILEKQGVNERAQGFVKKRGIKSHALFHINKKFLLTIDIKDFFKSIKLDKVKELFLNITKSDDLSEKLSRVCTYKGYLPQGGVTSPYISNLVFIEVDEKIKEYCDKKNINYSRYADDLTFSSNYMGHLKECLLFVEKLINEEGFKLNDKKTRFLSGNGKLLVTGLVLNSGILTVGRDRKRKLRSALHNLYIKENNLYSIEEIVGMLSFIRSIEPGYYNKFKKYKNNLLSKLEDIK